MTGPPGAGKSTVSALVADSFDSSVLIPGDWFFRRWRRGAISPWLAQASPQTTVAAGAAAAAAGAFARADCRVVYDGFILPGDLAGFAAAAGLSVLHYRFNIRSRSRSETCPGHIPAQSAEPQVLQDPAVGDPGPDRHARRARRPAGRAAASPGAIPRLAEERQLTASSPAAGGLPQPGRGFTRAPAAARWCLIDALARGRGTAVMLALPSRSVARSGWGRDAEGEQRSTTHAS